LNIFILDKNPIKSVQYHTNKHIVKMVTETAQLISYVYHIKQEKVKPFLHKLRKSHIKHPCTIWTMQSINNFIWLCSFGILLYNEYQYRYNQPTKHQKALKIFKYAINNLPDLPKIGMTKYARAIKKDKYPDLLDKNKYPDIVECYREYYKRDKQSQFFKYNKKTRQFEHCWKKRSIPLWIKN